MAQATPNSVIGVVEDIIFIGRVTKIRVRVEDDVVLTTTRLTTAEDLSLAPGTLVVWYGNPPASFHFNSFTQPQAQGRWSATTRRSP